MGVVLDQLEVATVILYLDRRNIKAAVVEIPDRVMVYSSLWVDNPLGRSGKAKPKESRGKHPVVSGKQKAVFLSFPDTHQETKRTEIRME